MKNNKILNPSFLEKFDNLLLKSNPRLWNLKAHYVLYYSIPINLMINLLIFIIPIKLYNVTIFFPIGITLIILEFIALIIWFYQLSMYNIEKQYGKKQKHSGVIEIFGYFFVIILIFATSFTFSISFQQKLENEITSIELTNDYKSLSYFQNYYLLDTIKYKKNQTTLNPLIEKYTGVHIFDENKGIKNIEKAACNCNLIEGIAYQQFDDGDNNELDEYFILLFMFFGLIPFIFIFRNTTLPDFIYSILYITFLSTVPLILYIIFESTIIHSFGLYDEDCLIIYVTALNIFLIYNIVSISYLRKYSRFKLINLSALVISIPVSLIIFLTNIYNFKEQYTYTIILYVIIFTMLLLPLTKNLFIKLFSLPKT